MELKEYVKIVKIHNGAFLLTVVLIVTAGVLYFSLRPVSYNTSLTLDITRSGVQDTIDYKFDDFYRLQADEKFTETVVQWLKSPQVVADIYTASGINPAQFSLRRLAKNLQSEKLSSQIVSISFSTSTPDEARKIAVAVSSIITKNIENLNRDQKDTNWFKIVEHDPIIVKNTVAFWFVLMVTLAIGIFLAFWVVFIIHYLE